MVSVVRRSVVCLTILLFNILFVSSRMGFLHKPNRVLETDHFHYIEMAKGSEGRKELAREPPYCWRILVPVAARLLMRAGLKLNLAFFLITNLSLLGFLMVIDLELEALGFDQGLRVLGLALLGLTQGAVRWFEYQYWMTDPTSLFAVALGLRLLRRDSFLGLALLSEASCLVRENGILLFLPFFVRTLRRSSLKKSLLRTFLVAGGPIATLVLIRLLVPPSAPRSLLASVGENLAFRWRHLGDNEAYTLTVGSLGVLFPLLFLFPRSIPAWFRRHSDLGVFVGSVVATLLISNNTERCLAYALPVLLPAALGNLREFLGRTAFPRSVGFTAVLGLQALFYSEQRFGEMGVSLYQPTNLAVVASMLLFWVGCEAMLHRAGTPSHPDRPE
ncbi:MAG TPA: hypothetical protein VN083_10395 [Vicinamibacteria bacterium]|nr:hypothetical protein [Vicinamibacteria bacterium]